MQEITNRLRADYSEGGKSWQEGAPGAWKAGDKPVSGFSLEKRESTRTKRGI